MAILGNAPGLEVTVVSNNRTLHEYPDPQVNDPENTTTKYLEVEADGAFQIHLQVKNARRNTHGIRVEVCLDGQKAGCYSFLKMVSKVDGRWVMSDFKFSQFVLGK